MPLLHAGDTFPTLTLAQPADRTLTLPDAFAGNFGVVLFTRGSWCRSCIEQLRAFQRSAARLAKASIEVAVFTADDESTTTELVTKYGLNYPIGHSADVTAVSESTGAFVSYDPPYLQSTGFVLDPDGKVLISVYSCGAIGQLLPDDVLDLIRDLGTGSDADTAHSGLGT